MKIKKGKLREKCRSEKYYASVKYMAHSLKGKEREQFIKTVCDINIYLGSLCAVTCEENIIIDKYIRKILNNYFKPKRIRVFNPSTQNYYETEKRLTEFDINNYLLANSLIDNFAAIEWYLYSHSVEKSTILKLAKNLDEEHLIRLIEVIYKSKYNHSKLRGIGATRNLYKYKNDDRIIKVLKGLWYKDRDAFIQLAYDTNWLSDLAKLFPKKKNIYVECIQNSTKLLDSIELLERALMSSDVSNKYENLLKLFSKNEQTEEYLYIIYLQKLYNGDSLTKKELENLGNLPRPSDKINRYFLSFFRTFITEYYESEQYLQVAGALKKVYCKPEKICGRIGYFHNANLRRAIKLAKNVNLEDLFSFYFETIMCSKSTLDDIIDCLQRYQKVNLTIIMDELMKIPFWAKGADGYNQLLPIDASTEKNIYCDTIIGKDEKILIQLVEYDDMEGIFRAKLYKGSISMNVGRRY